MTESRRVTNFLKIPLFHNAIFLMLNHLLMSGFGFFFWIIMARCFTPIDVGIGASLISASMLIGLLGTLGLGFGLIRFVPEYDNFVDFINTIYVTGGIASFFVAVIYLFGVEFWSPELKFVVKNIWFIFMFIFFSVSFTMSTLVDQSFIAGRLTVYLLWKNIVINILKLSLPLLLFKKMGGFGIFAGNGMAICLGVSLSWLFFVPMVFRGYNFQLTCSIQFLKQVMYYSFSNYLVALFNNSPKLIYPLMVLSVLGAESSAFFYTAWMMTMVLAVIPDGLAQSLLAEGANNQIGLEIQIKRTLTLSLLMAIPCVTVMIMCSEWLLNLFGEDYANGGSNVVKILSLGIIPQCINSVYIAVNQIKKRVYCITIQAGTLAVIALLLGFGLLKQMGLQGIGLAYSLSHLIIAIIVLFPLLKICKKNNKLSIVSGSKW